MKIDVLSTLPGVVASALVGPDGLPIESFGDGGEVLAAELASLRTSLDRTGRRLGSGEVTRLSFTSDRIEVVGLVVGDFMLGVALIRSSDTRAAQQTMAKLALDIDSLPRVDRS